MAKFKIDFRNKLIVATPLICVFVFLLIGFMWDKWHPGWIIFILIPVFEIFFGSHPFEKKEKDDDDDDKYINASCD